jgi:hypothetical protein
MIDKRTGEPYESDPWTDFIPLDESAKRGASRIVGNPATGDMASAYWHVDMWVYYLPDCDLTQQLDFEPTHYKRKPE